MIRAKIPFLILVALICIASFLVGHFKGRTNCEEQLPEVSMPRVTPLLGEEFGRLMFVEGELVAPVLPRHKGFFLLKIERVNGAAIDNAILLPIDVWGVVDVGKLGDSVGISGFEAGCFIGAPPEAFPYETGIAFPDFQFESRFQVIGVARDKR